MTDIIYVKTQNEIYNLKRDQTFSFICSVCGKQQIIKRFDKRDINSYILMMCTSCKLSYLNKIDNNSRYNKMKETVINKYGVDNVFKLQKFQDLAKKNKFEKYGDENYTNYEKTKETVINKYGVDNVFKLQKFQDLAKKKMEEKYGVKYALQSNFFLNKAESTSYKLYGSKHPSFSYVYYGIRFDSSWELAFYIYCTDNNYMVLREPIELEYCYCGKIYKCYPDFMVNGIIIEIKGPQFFIDKDTTNKMINDKDQAKYQCMLNYGVKFIFNCDFYLNYVKYKYGDYYLDTFKTIIPKNTHIISKLCKINDNTVFNSFYTFENRPYNFNKGFTPFDIGGGTYVSVDPRTI